MIEMSFIEMIIRNESENKEAARLLIKGKINKQAEEDTLKKKKKEYHVFVKII